MPKKRHNEERILAALHQLETGAEIADVCRKLGISTATFYLWRKKYSGLGLDELREPRQLREQNSKLKRLVADLPLNRHMLQELISKSCSAAKTARVGPVAAAGLPAQ